MAPPYLLGAMCTQCARSGNARSMFEKRKPGTRDGAVGRLEKEEEKEEEEKKEEEERKRVEVCYTRE